MAEVMKAAQRLSRLLRQRQQPSIGFTRGTVKAVGTNTLSVQVDGSPASVLTTALRSCNPAEGKQVDIIKSGTQWVAIGVVGGEGTVTWQTHYLDVIRAFGLKSYTGHRRALASSGENANAMTLPGVYYSSNSATTLAVANIPAGVAGASAWIEVEDAQHNDRDPVKDVPVRIIQRLHESTQMHKRHFQRLSVDGGATWTPWVRWSSGGMTQLWGAGLNLSTSWSAPQAIASGLAIGDFCSIVVEFQATSSATAAWPANCHQSATLVIPTAGIRTGTTNNEDDSWQLAVVQGGAANIHASGEIRFLTATSWVAKLHFTGSWLGMRINRIYGS
jgi:hypothetical protein